jgi:hypothetical protein
LARPRVFISSTYYDLKHLRSSLENFVQSLGFDAILSEKGKIAYTPDLPLDESCYREVGTSDIFVLVVGGRYGSEASAGSKAVPKAFYDRYNSITRGEYRSAADRDIPMYILVERSVYAEYETYLRNKSNKDIAYAHVDSVNIFQLIEDILALPRNNPIQQFDRYSEIESWLREQWSGLFRELLQRTKGHAQLATLQEQVSQMGELNKTLKTYLEEVVSHVAPKEESRKIIRDETKRLDDARELQIVRHNPLAQYLHRIYDLPWPTIRLITVEATSLESFFERLSEGTKQRFDVEKWYANLVALGPESETTSRITNDLNELRLSLGRPGLPATESSRASSGRSTKTGGRNKNEK